MDATYPAGLSGGAAEQQALLQREQRQEFVRVDQELQYNEVLIEERDEAIHEISQQIGEVHEIFQVRVPGHREGVTKGSARDLPGEGARV